MAPIEYIDRSTGKRVVESVMGDGALRFAYETLLGRTLWPVLFGSKLVSALMGLYYDSPRSRAAIRKLVAIPGCRADEADGLETRVLFGERIAHEQAADHESTHP